MGDAGQPKPAADAPAVRACACLLAILSVRRDPESPLCPAAPKPLLLGSSTPPPSPPETAAAAVGNPKEGSASKPIIIIMSSACGCCSSPASPSIAARVPLGVGGAERSCAPAI